jgi:hypothetical protein
MRIVAAKRGLNHARLPVLPRFALFGRSAMAILTLHLYRFGIGPEQAGPHVNHVIELDRPRIATAIAERRELGMLGIKAINRGLEVRRTASDLQIAVALHTGFIGGLTKMLRANMFDVTGGARRCEGLKRLMCGSLMTAQALFVVHMLTEADFDKAGFDHRRVAGIAAPAGERMRGRKRAADVGFRVAMDGCIHEPQSCYQRQGSHQQSANEAPPCPFLKVMEVVTLS